MDPITWAIIGLALAQIVPAAVGYFGGDPDYSGDIKSYYAGERAAGEQDIKEQTRSSLLGALRRVGQIGTLSGAHRSGTIAQVGQGVLKESVKSQSSALARLYAQLASLESRALLSEKQRAAQLDSTQLAALGSAVGNAAVISLSAYSAQQTAETNKAWFEKLSGTPSAKVSMPGGLSNYTSEELGLGGMR